MMPFGTRFYWAPCGHGKAVINEDGRFHCVECGKRFQKGEVIVWNPKLKKSRGIKKKPGHPKKEPTYVMFKKLMRGSRHTITREGRNL